MGCHDQVAEGLFSRIGPWKMTKGGPVARSALVVPRGGFVDQIADVSCRAAVKALEPAAFEALTRQ